MEEREVRKNVTLCVQEIPTRYVEEHGETAFTPLEFK